MKNLCLNTLMTLACLSGLTAFSAMAQTENRIEFTSPFEFTAGIAKLPAGNYSMVKESDNAGIYVISSRTTGKATLLIARGGATTMRPTSVNVTFTQRDGKYILDTVGFVDGTVVEFANLPEGNVKSALMVRKVRMVK